jgi:hypothetical protein
MNQEQTVKRFKEALSLPSATIEDLRNVPKGITTEVLNDYLKQFTKPTGQCWLCENDLMIAWGLVHGVANCTNCGIECLVYHYLKDVDGDKQKIEMTLQYHPNNYSVNEELN